MAGLASQRHCMGVSDAPVSASNVTFCEAQSRGTGTPWRRMETPKLAGLDLSVVLYVDLGHDGMGLTWHYILTLNTPVCACHGTTFDPKHTGLYLPWHYI